MRTGWMITVAVAVVSVFLAGAVRAQGAYTDEPGVPADIGGAWRVPALVEAFNAGDAGSIGAAIREHFTGGFAEIPIEEHARVWGQSRGAWGPIELVAFRTYDPPRASVVPILRSSVTGAYYAFVLETEGDEPHRFTGMRMAPARTPSFVEPAEPMEGAELAAAIGGLVDRMAAHDMFSGSVIVQKDGERVFERAAGLASRRFDVPNTMDTKFNLGSMNKMFTAVTVASLVEEGKLAYTDTVGAHLPDYPNADVREKVQVRHLLSHTSGMGSHFTDAFMNASRANYRGIDDYLELFAEDELAFEPGTDWQYSNAGFYVLGKIIEAAGGESYYDAVRARVYEPAGMADSDSYDMDVPVKNLAIGYTAGGATLDAGDDGRRWLGGRGWVNNYFLHSIKGGPAGGGFSTAPDLIRFAEALTGGALVSESSLSELTSGKPGLGSPDYGYGFADERHPVMGRLFGHSGGFPGINAVLRVYPETGYTIAVMANMDGAAVGLADQIERLISGQ